MYQMLEKFAKLESRLVYRALEVNPHPNDYVDFEFGPETEHRLTYGRLQGFMKSIRDALP